MNDNRIDKVIEDAKRKIAAYGKKRMLPIDIGPKGDMERYIVLRKLGPRANKILRRMDDKAKGEAISFSAIAREFGVGRQYVCDLARGARRAGVKV